MLFRRRLYICQVGLLAALASLALATERTDDRVATPEPAVVPAEPATDARALAERLAALTDLTLGFEQRQFDARGRLLEVSRGELVAIPPDRFRWRTDEPVRSLIVSDGETLWIHDEDLAQVVIRDLDDQLGHAPVRLLASDAATLMADFRVEQTAPDAFSLNPRGERAAFDTLLIAFVTVDGGLQLQTLTIIDALGQRTGIRFHPLTPAPTLDPSLFSFELPAGVEVVDARAGAARP